MKLRNLKKDLYFEGVECKEKHYREFILTKRILNA